MISRNSAKNGHRGNGASVLLLLYEFTHLLSGELEQKLFDFFHIGFGIHRKERNTMVVI